MNDIVHKICRPPRLVWDPLGAIHSSAKACLLLSRHWRFVRCAKDASCLQESMESLVKVYASHVLNDGPLLTGDDQLKESVHVHLTPVECRKLWKWLGSWGAPSDLPSTQNVQEHVVTYICVLHHYYSVFNLHATCKTRAGHGCGEIGWETWDMNGMLGRPIEAMRV